MQEVTKEAMLEAIMKIVPTWEGIDELLSAEEVAKILKMNKDTVYNMVHEGKIAAVKKNSRHFAFPKLALMLSLNISAIENLKSSS